MDGSKAMRAWFGVIIALGLPALELVGIYLIWQRIGAWTLAWLAAAAAIGLWLLRREHFNFLPRLAQTLLAGHTPFAVLFATARRILAGLLLIFPGAGSDLLALALLLWPGGRPPGQRPPRSGSARHDGVIEGEFERVDQAYRFAWVDPVKETLNKWLRGRIAAKRGVGFGRPLLRP
jgi:UPF0716 protein FxsA